MGQQRMSDCGRRAALVALALLASLQAGLGQSMAEDSVPKLGVFVESLCPDSQRFFGQQLVPAHQQLGHLFRVEIVPFGHARVLGGNRMICQHGRPECDGNRKMACMLARAQNQSQAIGALGCLFESPGKWRHCAKSHLAEQDDKTLEELEKCSLGAESYRMMEEAERRTGRVGYIPHLTLNGQSGDELQAKLENQLKRTICDQYKAEPRPEACINLAS